MVSQTTATMATAKAVGIEHQAPEAVATGSADIESGDTEGAAAVRVGLLKRQRRHGGVLDLLRPVAIPVTGRNLPRIVGVGERDEQQKRLIGPVARELLQLA